jgi:hypothetical protein
MAFDIEGAKSAGYSDAEIANFLGQQNNFDVAGAKKAGYSDTEILGHLTAIPAAKPVAPAVTPETQNFSALRQVADVPLQVGKGLVSGVRMISDAFGANSDTGKTLRGAENYIANLMSAQSKQDSQEVARIMKEAEDKGVLDQVKAGVKAFTVAPIDLLSNAFGTAGPAILASLGATVLGPAAAIGAGITVGSTMGAGTVKGSIYDAVKEELGKTKMPADQIEARAELAQAYNGNNLDMILTGAAIGALGATTGAEPAIARQISRGILAKSAVKQELKNTAEEGIKKAAERGMVKQAAVTGAKEFGTEFGQAGQEQLAQNVALQREGVDVPTMRGVVGQASLEGLAGLGLGTVAGGREALKAQDVLDQRKLVADQEAKLKEEELKKEQATTPEAKVAAQQNIDDILAAGLNAPKTDTFDVLSDTETLASLKADNAARKAKMDAGDSFPQRQTKYNKVEEQIKAIEAKLATATTPTTETVAPSVTPAPVTAPAVAPVKQAPAEYIAELDANKSKPNAIKLTNYLTALGITDVEKGKGFNERAIQAIKAKLGGQNVIQPTDAGTSGVSTEVLGGPDTTGAAPGITDAGLGRPGVDSNQSIESAPQDGTPIQQSALAEITPPVEEAIAEEVPTDEQVLSAEDQTTIEDEAAAELAGEVTPPVEEAVAEITPPVEKKKPVPLVIEADQDASTPEAQTKRNDVVDKVNAFEDIRKLLSAPEKLGILDKKAKTPGVQGEVIKEEKVAKPIKWRGEKGTKTKNPSPYNFLNENGYYSDKSPEQIAEQSVEIAKKDKKAAVKDALEAGVESAAFDEAYDLYDSIAYDEKVLPEIKAVMAERQAAKDAEVNALNEERNNNREAKRAQMTRDGKDEKVIKEALSVIKNVPKVKYQETKPLEFMSEQEVLDLFKKNVGTKTEAQMAKEGGQARIDAAKNRNAFVDVLSPVDKIKFGMMTESILDMEIISAVQDNKVTTAGDRRTQNYRKKQEKAIIDDVKEQLKQAELSTEEREKKEQAKAARIAQRAEERQQDIDTVKTKTEEAKSRYVSKIETAIAKGEVLNAKKELVEGPKVNVVLTAIQSDERGQIGNMAKQLNKLLKDLGLESKAKISFGKVENDADGKFDPATGNITVQGVKGEYKGKRNLAETVVHEVMHYLTDHVVANRKKYLESITDPTKRKQVNDALNRLDNNYKLVKAKFGSKYNIGEMKEFIAEMYSNPALQADVAMLPPTKPYQGNFFKTIIHNITTALGFTRSGQNEAVEFREIIEDIASIVSLPGKGNTGFRGTETSYSAVKTPKQPKQAPFLEVKSVYDSNPAFAIPDKLQKNSFVSAVKDIFTHQGIQKVVTKFQNNRQAIKFLENQNIRAGVNKDYGPDVNNTYTQITLAPVRAMNKFYNQIQTKQDELIQGIVSFAKTKEVIEGAKRASKEENKKVTPMLFAERVLGIYGQAFTDVERRLNMFVQTSPLDNKKKDVAIGNTMITAADFRDLVLGNQKMGKAGILDTNQNLTEDQARQIWERLENLVFVTDANGNKAPNPKYVVPGGYSPEGRTALDFRNIEGSTAYNVTGFTYDETNKLLKEYENDPHKELLDKIFDNTWGLNKIALGLNKESYYVSKPAANWIAAYGYQHYVPLKGITNHTEAQQRGAYDFNGKKEKDLIDTAIKGEGRFSVSNNPVLQTMSEAMISAMRAGKGPEYTLSIKNLIGKGINGRIAGTVPFNEKTFDNIKKLRKENTIFHHNEDGSIDVIEINDNNMLSSIRRTYKDENKFIEMANLITSGLGQMHTRYNVNFGPLNFVRDALTNAWNIGATLGPVKGAELITRMAVQIATRNSLGKAFQVARAYKTPRFEKYKDSADPIYRSMYELIKEGGMVEYLEGISLKSNLDKLNKEVGRSRIVKTKEGLDNIVDVWTSMFEIASRAAAYGVLKDHYMKEMNLDEKAAKIRAASTTKNLANFEQVGEYGKVMGALYMFFRPSATGAVRAIESITPMLWRSLERAERNMPEHIKNNLEAKATYMENYKKERRNAQLMTTVLAGAGALAYTMSYLMADTDDQDRNKVLTDDMGQWTRFWRIHIPGFDKPFQIPWGFGLGAFAAMGAQLAAVATGQQSFGSALKNGVTQIALDSFVPIPISRMDITDEPAAWFVDSLSPSFARPIVEFVANKNGLGQSIYNDATGRRMGDAYLGGDHVPETYKILTRWLAESTDGYIDWTPNSAYFLVNSYADGPARLIDTLVNNYYLSNGTKEFDAKTDFPFIGSFIGAAPNIDTREFTKVEKQINTLRQNVNQFKVNNPDYYYFEYLPNHPFDESIVKLYDKSISDLNELRAQDKIYRGGSFTLAERKELLSANRMQQNFIKHNLVEMFKAYDIEP